MTLSLFIWKIIYIIASACLLLYSLYSLDNWKKGIYIAIAINIVPFLFVSRISMDLARISGVPLSYIPIVAVLLSGIRFSRCMILNIDHSFVSLGIILCLYSVISGILLSHINFASSIPYIIGMMLNIFCFVTVRYLFINMGSYNKCEDVLKGIYIVLFGGTMIGILRYLSGIDDSANFMPANNRNCTVLFVVIVNAIGYYLVKCQLVSKWSYTLCSICSFVALCFVGSRSGIIGFSFVMLGIYLFCTDVNIWKKLMLLIFLCAISASLLIAFKDTIMVGRMYRAYKTIISLQQGENIEYNQRGVDSVRYTLLRGGIATINDNLLFGTGLGVTNYSNAFKSSFPGYNHYVNAHNFYISYFAQLGAIGFFIFISILYMIYRKLPTTRHTKVFRVLYFAMMVMMLMNEYILLPYLWVIFALLSCENRQAQ